MAGSLAGYSLHAGDEFAEHVQGDEGLDGTGKAAAMDPAGAAAIQQVLRQSEKDGHRLAAALPIVGYVLEIHEGGAAGLADVVEKGVKISPLQGVALQKDPLVISEEVVSPQSRPVAAGSPDGGQVFRNCSKLTSPRTSRPKQAATSRISWVMAA